MYYVNGAANLKNQIQDLLSQYFDEKAEVKWDNGKLFVTVKENAGFKDEHKYLSKEELERGVCGGGLKEGLDGKKFLIEVTEID